MSSALRLLHRNPLAYTSSGLQMAGPILPRSIGESLDLEQYERIRRVYDLEERERIQIPVREYVRHSPERVPSIVEQR